MANEQKTYTEAEVQQLLAQNSENAREGLFTQDQVNGIVADRLKRSKDTMEHYKAEMAAQAAAQAEADAMRERFAAAMGDKREPVHPRLEGLMLEDFKAAVQDPANQGKSDDEIFSALFKDQDYLKPKGAKLFPPSPVLPAPVRIVEPDVYAKAFGLTKGK